MGLFRGAPGCFGDFKFWGDLFCTLEDPETALGTAGAAPVSRRSSLSTHLLGPGTVAEPWFPDPARVGTLQDLMTPFRKF